MIVILKPVISVKKEMMSALKAVNATATEAEAANVGNIRDR